MIQALQEHKKAGSLLSICIPTFNRADCLRNCLESLSRAMVGYLDSVEVVVSDNASADNTEAVVMDYRERLQLRYFKNATNIGAEGNILAVAAYATTEYVWVFGDDDEVEQNAVAQSLQWIKEGYDLIVANSSSWSKDMKVLRARSRFPSTLQREYTNPNQVLSVFGISLGYISSVIVRKAILFAAPPSEYEEYVQYGFPHPYSIYCGLLAGCRVGYIAAPIVKWRSDNSDVFLGADGVSQWIKYFVKGTALLFEALGRKGYTAAAVRNAKEQTLKDYSVANITRGINRVNKSGVLRLMYRHYRSSWRFWLIWGPVLLLPVGIARPAHQACRFVRRMKSRFTYSRP